LGLETAFIDRKQERIEILENKRAERRKGESVGHTDEIMEDKARSMDSNWSVEGGDVIRGQMKEAMQF
jgi:hypothetical protein